MEDQQKDQQGDQQNPSDGVSGEADQPKKPRGKPFAKGGDQRQMQYGAVPLKERVVELPAPKPSFPGLDQSGGEPRELAMMRWVSGNAEAEGEPQDVKDRRRWKDEDLQGFLKELGRLERSWLDNQNRKASASLGEAAGSDGKSMPVSQRVKDIKALIQEMLAEARGQ